jgi:hypothetical protein
VYGKSKTFQREQYFADVNSRISLLGPEPEGGVVGTSEVGEGIGLSEGLGEGFPPRLLLLLFLSDLLSFLLVFLLLLPFPLPFPVPCDGL